MLQQGGIGFFIYTIPEYIICLNRADLLQGFFCQSGFCLYIRSWHITMLESKSALFLDCPKSVHGKNPEFLKTAARSTFGGNIPWKMSNFCRTKDGFKKCALSQIELIKY